MNGSGCNNCPVNPCETMTYRGSACAAQRAKFGLGDPQTNADRIRAMSDEELCKFLSESKYLDICEEGCDSCVYDGECDKRLLEWLKQTGEFYPCKPDIFEKTYERVEE